MAFVDRQKRRVYTAEQLARILNGTYNAEGLWTWSNLTELAKDSWKVRGTSLPMPELVLNRRLKRRSTCIYNPPHEPCRIEMAPTMCCPLVVLHELTHAETKLKVFAGAEPHGREYVAAHVQGVAQVLGRKVAGLLVKCYVNQCLLPPSHLTGN